MVKPVAGNVKVPVRPQYWNALSPIDFNLPSVGNTIDVTALHERNALVAILEVF